MAKKTSKGKAKRILILYTSLIFPFFTASAVNYLLKNLKTDRSSLIISDKIIDFIMMSIFL